MHPQDITQLESWETLLFRAAHDISLTKDQYALICKRYEVLQGILNVDDEPLLAGAHIFVQGSIGQHTTIKPPPGAEGELATIDADAIVWLPRAGQATAPDVLHALERRVAKGSRVDAKIEQLRRGVRIVYADESPGFHIDITPARNASGNVGVNGEGSLVVADRVTGWKASSPRPYSLWLSNASEQQIMVADLASLRMRKMVLAEATQDPLPGYEDYIDANPLRAAIKLLKRNRDTWSLRENKVSMKPISVLITTLASEAYAEIVAQSRTQPMRPIEALIALVNRMPELVRGYRGAYQVCNPTNPGENFAEKWNRPNGEGDGYRQAFLDWHAAASQDVRMGFRDFGRAEGLETAMLERFGVPKTTIKETIASLAADVTLPGRAPGITRNKIALAVLAGSTLAGSAAAAQPVGRLGDIAPVGRLG